MSAVQYDKAQWEWSIIINGGGNIFDLQRWMDVHEKVHCYSSVEYSCMNDATPLRRRRGLVENVVLCRGPTKYICGVELQTIF